MTEKLEKRLETLEAEVRDLKDRLRGLQGGSGEERHRQSPARQLESERVLGLQAGLWDPQA